MQHFQLCIKSSNSLKWELCYKTKENIAYLCSPRERNQKKKNPSKLVVIVMTSQTRVRSKTIHSVHGKEMLKEIRFFLHKFTFFTVWFVISSFMNYPKWCWIHTHAHVSSAVRATFSPNFHKIIHTGRWKYFRNWQWQ